MSMTNEEFDALLIERTELRAEHAEWCDEGNGVQAQLCWEALQECEAKIESELAAERERGEA